MLTYVINTSENKTFDSDKLFELSGYNKIIWINSPLNEVRFCAEDIYQKQNVLGADDFRIAVLVDFFNFDKIRPPYGRRGFVDDSGVEMSLYMPYIEVFLLDNLIAYLENRELFAFDFEIYYIQNEKYIPFSFMSNAPDQLAMVLTGKNKVTVEAKKVEEEAEDQGVTEELISQLIEESEQNLIQQENKMLGKAESKNKGKKSTSKGEGCGEDYFSSFSLYCTPDISLVFDLADYPYGEEAMTFEQFYIAFRQRMSLKMDIRRHYYVTNYGGGPARSAFDTLSLSLYLIRMYEREDVKPLGENLEIAHIDAMELKDVLQTAWNKVNVAKNVAHQNNAQYYVLEQEKAVIKEDETPIPAKEAIAIERDLLPSNLGSKMNGDQLYHEIDRMINKTPGQLKQDNREEFDRVMAAYLKTRDATKENDVKAELEELKEGGYLKTTEQCPSISEYKYAVEKKQKEISRLFSRALDAEYNAVEYSKEIEESEAAKKAYDEAKACMHKNIIGDLIFMLLSVLTMLVPYVVLQLSSHSSKIFSSAMLAIYAGSFFVCVFICAFLWQMIPVLAKMRKAKNRLRECYKDCCAKNNYSFSAIRNKFQRDLVLIERERYELRRIKYLFDSNMKKNANVNSHRELLEDVEDRLGSMLNNLDVEPVYNSSESVEGEFDITKPLRSRENKIYRVFSIEAIEKMFSKKGSEEQ